MSSALQSQRLAQEPQRHQLIGRKYPQKSGEGKWKRPSLCLWQMATSAQQRRSVCRTVQRKGCKEKPARDKKALTATALTHSLEPKVFRSWGGHSRTGEWHGNQRSAWRKYQLCAWLQKWTRCRHTHDSMEAWADIHDDFVAQWRGDAIEIVGHRREHGELGRATDSESKALHLAFPEGNVIALQKEL